MDQRLRRIVEDGGLTSVMNATKWRELATALGTLKEHGPQVRVKYLTDEHVGSGFAYLEWEWVQAGDTAVIEWMEIDTIIRTHRGRLVADLEEDLGPAIVDALRRHSIPFSREGAILKVWGYVRSGAQPAFA